MRISSRRPTARIHRRLRLDKPYPLFYTGTPRGIAGGAEICPVRTAGAAIDMDLGAMGGGEHHEC